MTAEELAKVAEEAIKYRKEELGVKTEVKYEEVTIYTDEELKNYTDEDIKAFKCKHDIPDVLELEKGHGQALSLML